MQFLRKGTNQYPNNNQNKVNEYEIKTFTGNNTRNRSPIPTTNYFLRRSPLRGKENLAVNNDSGIGEMMYLDPNEMNFRRNEESSPNNAYMLRSPTSNMGGTREIEGGGERSMLEQRGIPQFSIEFDPRRKRLSRSPKTINIGESAAEAEYNLRSIKAQMTLQKKSIENSPRENKENIQMERSLERSYEAMASEPGNIFLDQPMQQSSFIRQQTSELQGSPRQNQTTYDMRSIDYRQRSPGAREINYSMNPRDYQEPMPGILRKMSPQANVDGESDSNSSKNEGINQGGDLRTQLEKRGSGVIVKNDDGLVEGVKPIQNDMEKIEDMVKKDSQENITGEEVKKLVKQYVKAYDPRRDKDGNLISNTQVVIQSVKDDMFTDRYKVLQKMNKLSNILLSKNKMNNFDSLNRSLGGADEKSYFDKNTLNSTVIGGKRVPKRKNKFLYVSLAMLAGKGLNSEDRTILRRMRLDKGGVVDLAQEALNKKDKFKIHKVKASGRGHQMINPKYKEKAARIVQGWWRERKEKYKKILDQIIKIQSVWRGKFTRKYVYDIIYMSYLHQKFFDIMSSVLVNHVRPQVFEELFSKQRLIKEKLGSLLTRNDNHFSALRLRPYFLKWDAIANFLKRRIMRSEKLVIKKGDDKQRKKILKQYLDQWAMKVNLEKYIGKAKDAEQKRQKFFGTLNMINGLTSLSKNQVYKNTKNPIKNYLQGFLRNKLLNKICDKGDRRYQTMIQRYYFSKWKDAVGKGKLKDLKTDVFTKNVSHVHSRMDKIKLKKYFDRWRRHCPQGKKILAINDGAEILKKFTLRTTFRDPLRAFSEKCDNENKRQNALRLLIVKRRNLKNDLRSCFYRWKSRATRLGDKKTRNEIYTTLLRNLINNIDRRILYKRFNQWRQRPKVDMNAEMSKVRDFSNILKDLFKDNLIPEKKDFLVKLSKTRAEHAISGAGKKMFKNYNKKNANLLRYYFYKWRNQTKKYEISDLHQQLLRYLISNKEAMKNRNLMNKYLTRWRLFVGDSKNYDNMEKLKNVMKGGDILGNQYHRRIRNFITRLYQKMGKDYRPLFIQKLTSNLEKPRSSLRELFDRWRRVTEKTKAAENIRNLKGKIIGLNINGVRQRSDRDRLLKAFFHWRVMCKKPEEYYPKITKGFNLLSHYMKKNLCEEPFKQVQYHRNFSRPLLKILKSYKNQENRLLNGKMRNLLGRWRKAVGDIKTKELKTTIIYQTKNNLENNLKMKTLAKYFTRWKLYRRKGLDVNFSKGIDMLTEIYKRPFRQRVFDIYKEKINRVLKSKGAGDLAKASDKHKKHLLHKALMRWYRGAMNTDPNRMKKIKRRLRRFVKNNEKEPRAKAFFRWKNQVRLMQLRDKDMAKARKLIINQLRSNDRKNLNYAMSTWKKKIQQIREQYLKSLLVKQIKSSQMVKEQMNNQAKLRAALLKWRSKLAPIDYLDRLKHIRKGCKYLKIGIKSKHEDEIFKKIKELARENGKKYLLKDIITVLRPELAKYHMKRCMEIWKSKLGDTNRMKNKIYTLFDDYVYTDKVHEGLFKEPKEQIIDVFKQHNDKKKLASEKISKFLEGILNIKKKNQRAQAEIKLKKIIDSKEKSLKEFKKMCFIRYYRQSQKLKNDENSKIIQKFIKEKLRRYFNKRDLIMKGTGIFGTYLKRRILNEIKDRAKENQMKKVLTAGILRQEQANQKSKEIQFNKWKDIIPILKQHEAALKLQNAFRALLARKKRDILKQRIIRLLKIHEKYQDRNNKNKYSHFHDWLRRTLMLRNLENAKIIQDFCRIKMFRLQKKQAQEGLKRLFDNGTKHKLALVMEKASRIIGGKGEVVYKTVQDVLYKTPFDKFINRMKFLAKINTLKKIQPKIHEKIKGYFLPLTLKKWKENTYDQTVKQTKILQEFLRRQYEKKQLKDKLRREELLSVFVKKLQKNDLYKLQLPFNIWSKKAKIMQLTENSIKIQNAFRNYLAKQKRKDLLAQKNWQKMKNGLLLNSVKDNLLNVARAKNLKINRKKIVTILVNKKIVDDSKSELQKYFDKWRNYNTYVNKLATKIQNAFRTMKAVKEKNRLKRINQLLNKYLIKTDKTIQNMEKSKLRKWQNKVNLLNCDQNSRIIQNFIRPRLAKLINEKQKKFFMTEAFKITHRYILNAAKVNKMYKALLRPSLQKFSNNLKETSRHNKIKDLIKKLTNDSNEKYKILLQQKFLRKWQEKADKINKNRNNAASVIQRAFLCAKARAERKRLQKIREIMLRLTIKKSNITNNRLFSSFVRWMNIVKNMVINDNANIIQDFCRDVLRKVKEQRDLTNKLKMHAGLDKIFKIKFCRKEVFDKIKSASNKKLFEKFNEDMKKHRLITITECFKKIKQRAFDNKLRDVMEIPENLRMRILKKNIDIWKNNSQKLAKKRAAELIQKNFRIFLQKIRQENKQEIMRNILRKLMQKNDNVKQKVFNKWNNIAQKIKVKSAKQRAVRYLLKKFKISNARTNWKKLADRIAMKKRNKDLFTVVQKTKQYVRCDKFKDPLTKLARIKFFNKLKENKRKETTIKNLSNLLPKFENINNKKLLRNYLKKWINKTSKLVERENKFLKAMDAIDKQQLINTANKISSCMTVKKLLHDIPIIRAKNFIDKFKEGYKNRVKYQNLQNDLTKAKNSINEQNKQKALNKIFKLYAYHKLTGMFKAIEKFDKETVKKKYAGDFLKQLFINMRSKSQYNYENVTQSSNKAKITKMAFNKKIRKDTKIIQDKQAILKKCLPSFVNYLKEKINHRNQDTLDHIKSRYTDNKFCELLKKFTNRVNKEPKKEYVHFLRREVKNAETKPVAQASLYKLFRRKFIRTVTTKLQEPSKLYQLYYLVNVTRMHKGVARQRFFRELIRKWRFIAFSRKMARKKLELMYKNLHASYMQMADEFFGEDEINPSVIKEFEKFGNSVGMFTGQDVEVSEELNKKYYQTVDKKYVFESRGSFGNSDFGSSNKKVRKEVIEEEEIIEEEQQGQSNKREIKGEGGSKKNDLKKGFKSKYLRNED